MAKYIDLSVDETINLKQILEAEPPKEREREEKDDGSN